MTLRFLTVAGLVLGALAAPAGFASAQQDPVAAPAEERLSGSDMRRAAGLYAPSVWDLRLGSLARELPANEFIDFACGTNGGPPSRLLTGWTGFSDCEPEPGTGWHEVFFRYDDEPEFRAKAMRLETQARLYENTSVYEIPVIASALFDADGFLLGLRLITDPRVDIATREKGAYLSNFLLARFDGRTACEDLARSQGESDYMGAFVKRRCTGADPESGTTLLVESHLYRKTGQTTLDPQTNLPTEGLFESTTRFEQVLADPIADREARLAAPQEGANAEFEALVARAMNCPGCDLTGVNLKRAHLAGANLAGANLTGANLHAVDLAGADLTGANLTGANLNRATMIRVRASGADFTEASLYEARLDAADLSGASMNGILAANIRLVRANLTGARVTLSDLTNARLADATLTGADLSRSALNDAQFFRANLADAFLIKTSLWRAQMKDAVLTGADLTGADLYGADLRAVDLTGADLTGSRLTGAILSQARTDNAVFVDAMLPLGFRPAAGN